MSKSSKKPKKIVAPKVEPFKSKTHATLHKTLRGIRK